MLRTAGVGYIGYRHRLLGPCWTVAVMVTLLAFRAASVILDHLLLGFWFTVLPVTQVWWEHARVLVHVGKVTWREDAESRVGFLRGVGVSAAVVHWSFLVRLCLEPGLGCNIVQVALLLVILPMG